jgi:hypothetical protein
VLQGTMICAQPATRSARRVPRKPPSSSSPSYHPDGRGLRTRLGRGQLFQVIWGKIMLRGRCVLICTALLAVARRVDGALKRVMPASDAVAVLEPAGASFRNFAPRHAGTSLHSRC